MSDGDKEAIHSSVEPLPSAEDVLAGFENLDADDLPAQYEQEFAERYEEPAIRLETDYAHLQGIRDHYRHKGRRSYFLIALLGCMIGFQWFLLWKVGSRAWDFTQYEWLLPILLVQNLGQIIGLAFIVVKSLFRDLK